MTKAVTFMLQLLYPQEKASNTNLTGWPDKPPPSLNVAAKIKIPA
jgi:hypothetical protein